MSHRSLLSDSERQEGAKESRLRRSEEDEESEAEGEREAEAEEEEGEEEEGGGGGGGERVGYDGNSSHYEHHDMSLNNTQYHFHRPKSVKRKKKIFKLIGITLTAIIVTVLCILLVLYLPRAPSMEIVESHIIYISLRNLTATIEDTIEVQNRNFAPIELLSYEFYLYHNGTVVGMGSQTVEPYIPKRSLGHFTATKVLEDSDEYPQLAVIVQECNSTGFFTLETEAVSKWKYFFSSRSLVLSSTDTYACSIVDS